MNSLSWFLYLADILPSFGGAVITLSVLGFLLLALILPPKGVKMFGSYHEAPFTGMVDYWWVFVTLTTFFLIGMLVPSKDTIYLIAASEIGQIAIESPEAQELMDDLREIINLQIERLKG